MVSPARFSEFEGENSFPADAFSSKNFDKKKVFDPELSLDNFRRQLKTFLFAQY